MKFRHFLVGSLFLWLPLGAQTTNEDSSLAQDPGTGAFTFSWQGTPARTYFIQYSETLMSWVYLPVIEQGAGSRLAYGLSVSSGTTKFFLRLRYTDQAATDPYLADFDGDGIPNGWELENGLDPFSAADAAQMSGDLTNLQVYLQSLGAGGNPVTANPAGLVVYSP